MTYLLLKCKVLVQTYMLICIIVLLIFRRVLSATLFELTCTNNLQLLYKQHSHSVTLCLHL